ncbi:MAG: SNF2-related protein [Myxococcota bacterium]|nr:SNF2-related protein [Myxococcota bacterium]
MPAVLRGASPSRLIEAATDLARRGGDLPALQLLAAALQASPRHPQGHLLRLELLRRVGPERDLAAWLSSLRALYERAEATPSMVLELALVEERLGETTSALDHYHEVLALGALRAAALPLVELAQAGVQRCEQLVAAAAAAAEAARPRAPAPASRKSRKAEASPARPVAEASRAPAEPLPPRAEAVLTGRASMQLPVERPVVPVEVPVVCQFVPAPELETRLFAGPPDPFPVYQNAQELWGFGPELLATSPGQLGLSLPRPVPSPPPDTAWRSGPRPLARLADRLAALAGGRALICAADDDQGAALAGEVLGRLGRDGSGLRGLVLAPRPLLRLWERELAGRGLAASWLAVATGAGGESPALLLADVAEAEKHVAWLGTWSPDLVILDQAQVASSLDSRPSRLLQQLAAPGLLLLSSTPVVSDLLSLHGLVSLVRPGLLDSGSQFRRLHVSRLDPGVAEQPAALRQLLADVLYVLPDTTAEEDLLPAGELLGDPSAAPGHSLPARARRLCAQLPGPGPGLLLGRDADLVRHLGEELAAVGLTGWRAVADEDPLPADPPTVSVVVHLGLPAHPVDGALRAHRFAARARQVILLPETGPERLLAELGIEASGLPAWPAARRLARLHLRTREQRPPLHLFEEAWAEGGIAAAERERQRLQEELGRARELVGQAAARSRALGDERLGDAGVAEEGGR